MRIETLHIQNFRGFQDITLNFQSSNLAVFIGINGAGKSTILDCIAIMLAQFVAKLRNREVADIELSENDIRLNSDSNINTITISLEDGKQISWRMVKEGLHGQNHNNYDEIENYIQRLQKSEEQALEELKKIISIRLENIKVIPIEIELPQNKARNHWMKFAGIFRDDAAFAEIAESLRAERNTSD